MSQSAKRKDVNGRWAGLIGLFLILAVTVVYLQVGGFEFLNFDDDSYITKNPHVLSGLTAENVNWAFRTSHTGNWHPLTWISHMIDVEFFGMKAGMHHLVNLLFHIANTLLLFIIFRRMTGAFWKSALVAALFALHPLHVESVAWVAERKDVLSTFFWMLALLSYLRYTARPGTGRYAAVFFFFILGLLSKPMVVTFPFVILLLDWWPLQRMRGSMGETVPVTEKEGERRRESIHFLIMEKVPFFLCTVLFSVVTYLVQRQAGSVRPFDQVHLADRVANAVISYAAYMGKLFRPVDLAVFYPYPRGFEPLVLWGSVLILLAAFLLVLLLARKRPWYVVGWLWYLGTLVPVIGLVQVGGQAMADRYTYIPLVGLFIMLAWGLEELSERLRLRTSVRAAALLSLLMGLAVLSWVQVGYWKNNFTLFTHAVEVTRDNDVAFYNLGNVMVMKGNHGGAIQYYSESLRIKPGDVRTLNNLGVTLKETGRLKQAVAHFRKALKVSPGDPQIYRNLADALKKQGVLDDASYNYGNASVCEGNLDDAVVYYEKALKLNPLHAEAHNNLGYVLARRGRIGDAVTHFREAVRLKPGYRDALNNLKGALSAQLSAISEENQKTDCHAACGGSQ